MDSDYDNCYPLFATGRTNIMPMKIGDPRPSFSGATDWLNQLQETADDYVSGRPTLVYFWATSCEICKQKFPQLRELIAKYKPNGLRSVAVHMPRYESDTDLAKVKTAVTEHCIDDICAIDNKHKLKDAFLNEQGWVPVYYLFDGDGKLKTRAAGEFGLGIIQQALEKMFAPQQAAA